MFDYVYHKNAYSHLLKVFDNTSSTDVPASLSWKYGPHVSKSSTQIAICKCLGMSNYTQIHRMAACNK